MNRRRYKQSGADFNAINKNLKQKAHYYCKTGAHKAVVFSVKSHYTWHYVLVGLPGQRKRFGSG